MAKKLEVRGITTTIRQEVKPNNLRTKMICTGAVETKITESTTDPIMRKKLDTFYRDYAIPASSFSRAVIYAMSQPDNVDINEVIFRPTNQPF